MQSHAFWVNAFYWLTNKICKYYFNRVKKNTIDNCFYCEFTYYVEFVYISAGDNV